MAITQISNLPQQYKQDLQQDYAKQLTGLTSVPLDTSRFAPTVAAQDALQTRAATLAGTGVGSFQPFITAAQQQATDAGTTLGGIAGLTGAPTAAQTQAYTSPFQQQVIDTTLAEFDRQRSINEQNIRDQAAAMGSLGAGRTGVQLSEYQSQSGRDRSALEAQLRQQGFQQAQAARQQDIQNRFGLGQAQAGFAGQRAGLAGAQLGQAQFQTGLASLVPGLQRADVGQLGALGAIDRSLSQAQLDAQRQATQQAATRGNRKFEPSTRTLTRSLTYPPTRTLPPNISIHQPRRRAST